KNGVNVFRRVSAHPPLPSGSYTASPPRQSARAVIPSILAQLLADRPELRLGDLETVRDMNFVADTVAAFLRVAECDEACGQTIHVGTGRAASIGENAELAVKVGGRKGPNACDRDRLRPTARERRVWPCNPAKALRLTGWEPCVGLEAGLERTARFVAEQLPLYRPEEYVR